MDTRDRVRDRRSWGGGLRGPLLAIGILALGFLAHAGALKAQFVFDGPHMSTGLQDERWPFWTLLLDRKGATSAGRPVMAASWAANLAVAEWQEGAELPDPRGFLLVNLLIHLATGLAGFALLRRILAAFGLDPPTRDGLAFAAAGLWIVHPLTTAAVAHVAQRAESLMALFFLLSLLAAWASLNVERSGRWVALATALAWLCVGSKESGAILPLAFALLHRAATGKGFARALRERAVLYLGLASSWLVLAAQLVVQARGPTVGWFGDGLHPLNYLLSQAQALVTYGRLVVWPSPLILDRGWPLVDVHGWADLGTQLASYGPALAAVALVLVATCWALARHPRAALPTAMAFLLLAPTSSVLPIRTEIIAEHRMYLPLTALLAGIVVAVWNGVRGRSHLARATALLLWCGAVAACTVATQVRNREHQDAVALWERNAALTPDNPRALARAGTLQLRRRPKRARTLLREAARVAEASQGPARDVLSDVHYMLGVTEDGFGRSSEAVSHLERSLEADPNHPGSPLLLVRILIREGELDRALVVAERAFDAEDPVRAIGPSLASLQLVLGHVDAARTTMARHLEADPESKQVADELTELARSAGRWDLVLLLSEPAPESRPAVESPGD